MGAGAGREGGEGGVGATLSSVDSLVLLWRRVASAFFFLACACGAGGGGVDCGGGGVWGVERARVSSNAQGENVV